MITRRIAALWLSLAAVPAVGCGGASASLGGASTESSSDANRADGLGPFRLGMSAVDLRVACVDHDGHDWSPNRHAFSRGCEVTLNVQGVTFQRFEMRLDGPSGQLVRLRGHADNADELATRRAFPQADIIAVEDVVLVTVSAEPMPAPSAAARLPE